MTKIDLISRLDEIVKLMRIQKDVLTLSEAATYMGVSKQYLYSLTARREIPYYKPSKYIYFRREELEEYLLQNPIATNEDIEVKGLKFLNNINKRDRKCI